MKILFQCRPVDATFVGGDIVQVNRTRAALENLGVEISFSSEANPDLARFDAVHLFGVQSAYFPLCLDQALNAKRNKVPVVLSSIYWSPAELMAQEFQHGRRSRGLGARAWYVAKRVLATTPVELVSKATYASLLQRIQESEQGIVCNPFAPAVQRAQSSVLLLSDAILPNTQAELEVLRSEFGIDCENCQVVPNAADLAYADATPDLFHQQYSGWTDFVFCAARIEPRKNTLNLIRANRATGLKLILAGDGSRTPAYASQCRAEASDNVLFTGPLTGEMLGSAYAAAKVHALPSVYETPGLASLEAAAAGCNLVCTRTGGVDEYLPESLGVQYCVGTDVDSIRDAVAKAHAAPANPSLKQHVLQRFTWDATARQTLAVYERILAWSRRAE